MTFTIKQFLAILFISGFFLNCEKNHAMQAGYELEEIENNQEILRAIATHIISQEENISFVQTELRRKHSNEAFSLWSQYNQNDLPNAEGLRRLNLSNNITQGNTIDTNFRKNNLRPLVGKTKMTVFSEENINSIAEYLREAVLKGHIALTINKMQAERYPEGNAPKDTIEVRYTFSMPIAQLFEKTKTQPPEVSKLESKNLMIAVMFSGEYIQALLADRNALSDRRFQGRINTVYFE